MKTNQALGSLLESFLGRVSHPRGRVLSFLSESSVTVDQAILLNHATQLPHSTPSRLAARMNLSLPSISQMIERLVRLGMVHRREDPNDRRQRTIEVTEKAKTFLEELREARASEFADGAARLSVTTQERLIEALQSALAELATKEDE